MSYFYKIEVNLMARQTPKGRSDMTAREDIEDAGNLVRQESMGVTGGFVFLFIIFLGNLLGAEVSTKASSLQSIEQRNTSKKPELSSACRQNNCKQTNHLIQAAVNACEYEFYVNDCAKFKKEHPEYEALIKACDPQSVCQETTEYLDKTLLACGRGARDAWFDWVSGVQSIYHWVSTKENDAKSEFEERLGGEASSSPAAFLQKVSELGESMVDVFTKAKLKYQCFKEIPKLELKCYVVGGIVDPLLVGGYALKIASRVSGKIASRVKGKVVGAKRDPHDSLHPNSVVLRQQFKRNYAEYSPTSAAQNELWMRQAVNTDPQKSKWFFDVENSRMKELNDTLKDKDLVTSLTNYHKQELFKEVRGLEARLQSKYPGITLHQYSDFKSSRFIFSGADIPSKDLLDELQAIHQRVNQKITVELNNKGLLRKNDEVERWFRAGFGDTADRATQSSRYSREFPTDNKVYGYGESGVKQFLQQSLKQAEERRDSLQRYLSHNQSQVFDGDTLHIDAFDIIRKNMGSPERAKIELQNRFGIKSVQDTTIKSMQDYVGSVDKFVSGLQIKERAFVSLADAHHGGMTADMLGLGASNLRETALAMKNSKTADEVIAKSRLAERKVTAEFKTKVEKFDDAMISALGEGNFKKICSGDDCVSVPKSTLSDSDKSKVINEIAKKDLKLRMSFVAPDIRDIDARNLLGNHGEGVEKVFRKLVAAKVDPKLLDQLIFGIDMRTTVVNEGSLRLFVGKNSNVALSTQDKVKLEQSFFEAVQTFNEQQRKNKIQSHYSAEGFWKNP